MCSKVKIITTVRKVWPCVPPPCSALAIVICGSQDGHRWLKLRAENLSQQLKLVDHAPAKLQLVLQVWFNHLTPWTVDSSEPAGLSCMPVGCTQGSPLDLPSRLVLEAERILICARYLVSELRINSLRLWNLSWDEGLTVYIQSFRHKPLTKYTPKISPEKK